MINKKKAPAARHSQQEQGKKPYRQYSEEFTECQAERIFNHDLNVILAGAIVILVLAILGVI